MYSLRDSALLYLHFIISMDCFGILTNGAYWLINRAAKSSKLVIDSSSWNQVWASPVMVSARQCKILAPRSITVGSQGHVPLIGIEVVSGIWIPIISDMDGQLHRVHMAHSQFQERMVRCWVFWLFGQERTQLVFFPSPTCSAQTVGLLCPPFLHQPFSCRLLFIFTFTPPDRRVWVWPGILRLCSGSSLIASPLEPNLSLMLELRGPNLQCTPFFLPTQGLSWPWSDFCCGHERQHCIVWNPTSAL